MESWCMRVIDPEQAGYIKDSVCCSAGAGWLYKKSCVIEPKQAGHKSARTQLESGWPNDKPNSYSTRQGIGMQSRRSPHVDKRCRLNNINPCLAHRYIGILNGQRVHT
ncbi:hypothetical protein Trydic_g18326 [Trypoxylus dichotomus]